MQFVEIEIQVYVTKQKPKQIIKMIEQILYLLVGYIIDISYLMTESCFTK